jgi:3-methylcrotonyl-CoA carboxylase alpha subunit
MAIVGMPFLASASFRWENGHADARSYKSQRLSYTKVSSMQYQYDYNGQIYTIRLERRPDGSQIAHINGEAEPFSARPQEGGWHLTFADHTATAHTATTGDQRFVQIEGQAYALTTVTSTSQRRRSAAASGDLTAQMPGQIRDVRVQEGDAVEAGQTLVVMEAMKMEMRITAPRAARVKRVLVQAGAIVERGAVLVELE